MCQIIVVPTDLRTLPVSCNSTRIMCIRNEISLPQRVIASFTRYSELEVIWKMEYLKYLRNEMFFSLHLNRR